MTDYNFGTLIRRDCERAYDEDNAILVTRVQFFGLEVSQRAQSLEKADHGRLLGIEQG